MQPMRYAHSEGHTDICFEESGKHSLTCGSDGEIRVWEGFNDDDPVSHHVAECAHGLAIKGSKVYVSTDSNAIQCLTYPEMEPDGLVARFTLPAYHISISPDGSLLAAGGGDFEIKVVDLGSRDLRVLKGHAAPVLSIALDSCSEYLASSSCDGTVRIWKLATLQCPKIFNLLPKSSDFSLSKTLCRMSWQPGNSKLLAVPVGAEVQLFRRDSWDVAHTLVHSTAADDLTSIAAFSPSGHLLAACSSSGLLTVWDVATQTCLQRHSHPKSQPLSALAWHPDEELSKDLYFCDVLGQLGVVENIAAAADSKPQQEEDDEILSESGELGELPLDDYKPPVAKPLNEEDIDFETDIGAIKAMLEPKIFGTQEDGEQEEKETKSTPLPGISREEVAALVRELVPRPVVELSLPQPAFQPGSTPAHLQHRFMVWNSVGLVRCIDTEEEDSSIEVEFHDSSVHHPLRLANLSGHTLGSVSLEAVVLAGLEGAEPSRMTCLHFSSWDSSKEWSVDMPAGENILALAQGSGWLALATDQHLLRVFTLGGLQAEVLSLPGPVVCLAGHEQTLAVVFHQGPGFQGDQNLGLLLHHACPFSQGSSRPSQPLALSPCTTLVWLGFTDEGTVCTVDSGGMVRFLVQGCRWLPVSNTKSHTRGKSDTYFVVGLSEVQQQIRCLPCKGSRYPPTLPRPVVAVLPLQLPLCEQLSDKGKLEEEHLRSLRQSRLLSDLVRAGYPLESEQEGANRQVTDSLMRMFALATRAGREYRALEAARLMPSQRAVQGAVHYATQLHRLALAERLAQVAHDKAAELPTPPPEPEPEPEPDRRVNGLLGRDLLTPEDSTLLQPKPVYRRKLHKSEEEPVVEEEPVPEEEMEEDIAEEAEQVPAALLLPKSMKHESRNPFKVTPVRPSSSDNLDQVLSAAVTSKPPAATNFLSKMAGPVLAPKKRTSPAEAYLEEHRAELQEELGDGAKEADLRKLANQKLKEMSAQDKQKYKGRSSATAATKRKLDSAPSAGKKAKLGGTTSAKLSMFSFTKAS